MRVQRLVDDPWRGVRPSDKKIPDDKHSDNKVKVVRLIDEGGPDQNEMARSSAYAAWNGQDAFAKNGMPSSANEASRVDPAGSQRQPIAPSQDREDPFRRRWLDTLLDTNMERSGVGRPVKTGPQPVKPIAHGLLDALREALDNNDGYSDPLRGPVAI